MTGGFPVFAGCRALRTSLGSRGRRFKSCRPDGEIGRHPQLRMPPFSLSDLGILSRFSITCGPCVSVAVELEGPQFGTYLGPAQVFG